MWNQPDSWRKQCGCLSFLMGYETELDAPDVEERIHASYRDWNQWTLLSYNWQIEAFCFADLVEFLMPQLSTLQCPELPADFSIPGGIVAGHFRTFGGLGVSLSGVTLVRHGHDIAGWWTLCPLCQHGSCCLHLWFRETPGKTQLTLDGKPCNPSSSAQEAHPLWSIAFCKINQNHNFQRYQYQCLKSTFFSWCLKFISRKSTTTQTPQSRDLEHVLDLLEKSVTGKPGEVWMKVDDSGSQVPIPLAAPCSSAHCDLCTSGGGRCRDDSSDAQRIYTNFKYL